MVCDGSLDSCGWKGEERMVRGMRGREVGGKR
jgi:hypothetical protein